MSSGLSVVERMRHELHRNRHAGSHPLDISSSYTLAALGNDLVDVVRAQRLENAPGVRITLEKRDRRGVGQTQHA